MPEDPVTTLERWRDSGADYRVVHVSDAVAIVDLCTCYGEPVERLESEDPKLISYLRTVPKD
jgi:(2Fe-2S) ferredoxin